MHREALLFFVLLASLLLAQNVCAGGDDIFGEYNSAIRKEADAKATNVYNAWGENMANLIESNYRNGVVIKGEGEYNGGKIRSDGLGNVEVEKGANVGPIINKTKIENSTIVIKKNSERNKW